MYVVTRRARSFLACCLWPSRPRRPPRWAKASAENKRRWRTVGAPLRRAERARQGCLARKSRKVASWHSGTAGPRGAHGACDPEPEPAGCEGLQARERRIRTSTRCCAAALACMYVVMLPRLAPPESRAVPVYQYAQRRGDGVLAAIVCSRRLFAHACGKACTRLQRV